MRLESTKALPLVSASSMPLFCLLAMFSVCAVAEESTSTPAADAQTAYVDQLIDPLAPGSEEFLGDDEQQQPEGYRSFSTQYLHFQQDIDTAGKSYEDGVILHGQRETRHYGELEMYATARYEQPLSGFDEPDNVGGRLTLRQYGFAASNNWLLDNSLGILRSDADPVLSNSYRISLPSTLVSGAKNWSRNGRTDLRISAGRIGTLGVGRIEDFDTTSGSLASLGASHAMGSNWLVTGQFIAIDDSDEVPDHESGAAALQYQTDDLRHRYVGHALLDSEGGNGIWLDGDDQLGRWRHRYGIFRLDPDLLWSDAPILDDQQGIYTRSELRSPRYNLTLGTDFNENNVDQRDDLPQRRNTSVFVTGNRRLQRYMSVGGTASFNRLQPRNDLAGDRSQILRLSTFVQQRFGIGTSRLEVFIADIEEAGEDGDAHGLIWDQSWDLLRELSLSTTLSHARTNRLTSNQQRDSASVLFTHTVTPEFIWNGSATYTRVKTTGQADTDNYNATLGAVWYFRRHWDARLDLTWTRAEEPLDAFADVFDIEEKSLLFRVRHDFSGGRPYLAMGNQTGSSGFGEISGEVFYDMNRDGERQAGERAASGVFVYLDGRYESVTDNLGRYTFRNVPAGDHKVSVAVEDLALPWGLDDETPRAVGVTVRQSSMLDFALTRINE